MASVGIIGASGYTGAELLRILAGHPDLDVVLATGDSQAGSRIADLYPSLAAAYGDRVFDEYDPASLDGLDVAFLGLPHGASQAVIGDVRAAVPSVVDLSADFRLLDAALYRTWYGEEHTRPELLGEFVYGLPERYRDAIADAGAVAAPGCYPTAAALALGPLVDAGLVSDQPVVVDAASGVSGAGRAAKPATTFGTVDGDFTAYGLLDHRHTPEIEQVLGIPVLFTPHLAPMTRGILATCYARPAQGATAPGTGDLLSLYAAAYADEQFVVVSERSPSTKATAGSNAAHVTVRHDERTGWLMAICAIDNLVKGASGQAVQCANLMLGLDEASGLTTMGQYP